MKKGSVSANFS